MPGAVLLTSPIHLLFFGQKNLPSSRCIDFIDELRGSLALFSAGFLADYFSHVVAGTAALFVFLVLMKASAKSKRFLAVTSLPLVYLIVLRAIEHAIITYLSYCF